MYLYSYVYVLVRIAESYFLTAKCDVRTSTLYFVVKTRDIGMLSFINICDVLRIGSNYKKNLSIAIIRKYYIVMHHRSQRSITNLEHTGTYIRKWNKYQCEYRPMENIWFLT